MQHPDELHHHDGDATQASERPDPADALRPFDPHVQVVTDDGQTIPLERQEDGSYAGVIPGRVVTSGYVLTPAADVVSDPAVQDDERDEDATYAAERAPWSDPRHDVVDDLRAAVAEDMAAPVSYADQHHDDERREAQVDVRLSVQDDATPVMLRDLERAIELAEGQTSREHLDRLTKGHPAAAGAGPDDPRTAPSEEDEAYARRLLLHGSAAVDLGRWPEDVEPVPPIVHRFRLHVFRSPAPTRLQQQVAGSEDGVLAAAIAQLPACPDEALRFNLLLDAMRDGLAPFARGRHAVQALVSGETAERWTTPMIRALLPAELVDGPTAEPNPRSRALAVATRLPLGDTRASQGLWSSKGCHWGAGMANVVVTDADGTPPGHRRGDDTDNAGDLT